MGYTTEFRGVLKFQEGATIAQLAFLRTNLLDEDRRDHPEWNAPTTFHYIDLRLTEDLMGLEWSGAEKSYEMADQILTVLRVMQAQFPSFDLSGTLEAQGEIFDDTYTLTVANGEVTKTKIEVKGRVECPCCGEVFVVDMKEHASD